MEEFRAFSISFFGAEPIEYARTKTKNETLVRVLVHYMRGLDGRTVGHFTQLEQHIDPGPIFGLNGNLRL